MTVEFPDDLKIGQAVCKEDVGVGFIYDVNPYNKVAEVILWEPIDIELGDNMTFISSNLTKDQVFEFFKETMNKSSKAIRQEWKKALKRS